jgi:hypothetical protein
MPRVLTGEACHYVVDLSKSPEMAAKRNILATPTIVTNLPGALRTFVGDLSSDSEIRVAIEKAR